MIEKNFLDEHPGLKGKVLIPAMFKDIHETQIDKQKLNEAIDKVIPEDKKCANNMILNNQLKKELGLE